MLDHRAESRHKQIADGHQVPHILPEDPERDVGPQAALGDDDEGPGLVAEVKSAAAKALLTLKDPWVRPW